MTQTEHEIYPIPTIEQLVESGMKGMKELAETIGLDQPKPGMSKVKYAEVVHARLVDLAADDNVSGNDDVPEANESYDPDGPYDSDGPSSDDEFVAPIVEKGDILPIARRDRYSGAWWCPMCDHSHEATIVTCEKCGATRDEDEVRSA